jgi:hypothetical protein
MTGLILVGRIWGSDLGGREGFILQGMTLTAATIYHKSTAFFSIDMTPKVFSQSDLIQCDTNWRCRYIPKPIWQGFSAKAMERS